MSGNQKAEYAIERALYPFIKLLIDSGVSFGQFSNVAKRSFVKVAADKLAQEDLEQKRAVAELIRDIVHERANNPGSKESPLTDEQMDQLTSELESSNKYVSLIRELLRQFGYSELTRATVLDQLPSTAKLSDIRISIVTGVSRKEVHALLNSTPVDQGSEGQRYIHRCNKVLAHWHEHINYTDNVGAPIPLVVSKGDVASDTDFSFEQLVAAVDGDLSHHALLRELESAGSVRVENGRVIALSSRFERHGISVDTLADAAERMYAFGEALNSKLRNSDLNQMFEGIIIEPSPDDGHRKITLKDLRSLANNLLDRGQRVASRHQQEDGDKDSKETRVGIGVYVLEGDEMARSEYFILPSELEDLDSETG